MRPYDFTVQHKRAAVHEPTLDAYFTNQGFNVVVVDQTMQRLGIDRVLQAKPTLIEYKNDFTASDTGNAFIETMSVSTTNRPGWVYTAQSDWLVYSLPHSGYAYLVRFADVRAQLPRWIHGYQTRNIQNKGYTSSGLLVPLHELEALCGSRVAGSLLQPGKIVLR
jgi:hypothetical protein